VVPPCDLVISSSLSHQKQPLESLETNQEEENAIEREGDKTDKIVYVIVLGFTGSSIPHR
jgi:hypothetical protein